MTTGHEAGPTGDTDGSGSVETGPALALCRQLVNMWCLNLGVAIASQVSVTKVVDEDQDDVGPRRGSAGGGCQ